MHILHQPVEDRDVAVHRDIDIIEGLLVGQVLLKVLHRREKQRLVATEVLCALFRLVTDVDQHLVLKACAKVVVPSSLALVRLVGRILICGRVSRV